MIAIIFKTQGHVEEMHQQNIIGLVLQLNQQFL